MSQLPITNYSNILKIKLVIGIVDTWYKLKFLYVFKMQFEFIIYFFRKFISTHFEMDDVVKFRIENQMHIKICKLKVSKFVFNEYLKISSF